MLYGNVSRSIDVIKGLANQILDLEDQLAERAQILSDAQL